MKTINRPSEVSASGVKQRRRGRRLFAGALAAGACLAAALSVALACGPWAPAWLLISPDDRALAAPVLDFFREIARQRPAERPRFQAIPPEESHAAQTAAADLGDLRTALGQGGFSEAEIEEITRAHAASRERLQRFAEDSKTERGAVLPPEETPPATPGLPPEFADYFRGALAYYQGRGDDARDAWSALLRRPAQERHFRSTWAAYMLGRLDVDTDPGRAIEQFLAVRELAAAGFSDTAGLAAASYGWEARAFLNQKNYRRAIELYLDHLAAGDPGSAAISLRAVAARACAEGEEALRPLAASATARSVVTAYLVSRIPPGRWAAEPNPFVASGIWLGLMEETGVGDIDLAEQLALAAYQAGEFDLARRWLERSRFDAPLVLWLRAKLELRAGRVDNAAALLTQAARHFPEDSPDEPGSPSRNLHVPDAYEPMGFPPTPAKRYLDGERGIIHLHRREFTEALDALLRSGHWMEAAYVAERVLTLEELVAYVERHWPDRPPGAPGSGDEGRFGSSRLAPRFQGPAIRYLLARRLARQGHFEQAGPYYPGEERARHDERIRLLDAGRDLNNSQSARAESLMEAARLTRVFGIELFGTEVEPDWRIHWGGFTHGVTMEARRAGPGGTVLGASEDELARAARHGVTPEKRYHYRYAAADLAWEAAALMPNNSDATALVLWEAGTWLKTRDPQAADRFYKALVRRCGATELGREADARRWFPELDKHGKVVRKNAVKIE